LLNVLMMGAGAFYAKFGAYPGSPIVLDFVAAPSAFIAYTGSGASLADTLLFAGTLPLMMVAAVAATRRIWHEPAEMRHAVWNIVLGSALLWALRDSPTQAGSVRFLIAEHSMPIAKYLYGLAATFDSNRVEAIRPYIPRAAGTPATMPVPPARHVLLIIAECLRADRLPAYGYGRNTMPFVTSEGDEWLVFKHAYAHGPATAANFPVLFNSQYFAALTRDNQGSSALWRFLRERGAKSAFLSAGAMEWAGITHSLDLAHADVEFIASNADSAERRKNSEHGFDYAVDDSIPLHRYINLLETEFARRKSFAVVHLVGSHYPFHYDDTPDVFLPSLRRPGALDTEMQSERREVWYGNRMEHVSDATVARISNSFDNSIVHIDGIVRRSIEALERLDILEDSVVIVTSDHGESLGEHRTFFHGTSLYDEQVHVPLLVRVGSHLGPAHIVLESRQSSVVGHIDLVPTILHLLTGQSPGVNTFEGVSLLSGYRKPYELLLFRGTGEKVAIATEDRKYIFDVPGQLAEEYSLRDDPDERQNLWRGDERTVTEFTGALVKRGVLSNPPLQ
jgi:glucan phosphoethanolaminetransferase (alkaline phosphatase superfamily)